MTVAVFLLAPPDPVRGLRAGHRPCTGKIRENTNLTLTPDFVRADIHCRGPTIFEKINLDAELKYFADGALAMPALVAGELDVTATTLNAGLFNTASQRRPIQAHP